MNLLGPGDHLVYHNIMENNQSLVTFACRSICHLFYGKNEHSPYSAEEGSYCGKIRKIWHEAAEKASWDLANKMKKFGWENGSNSSKFKFVLLLFYVTKVILKALL